MDKKKSLIYRFHYRTSQYMAPQDLLRLMGVKLLTKAHNLSWLIAAIRLETAFLSCASFLCGLLEFIDEMSAINCNHGFFLPAVARLKLLRAICGLRSNGQLRKYPWVMPNKYTVAFKTLLLLSINPINPFVRLYEVFQVFQVSHELNYSMNFYIDESSRAKTTSDKLGCLQAYSKLLYKFRSF